MGDTRITRRTHVQDTGNQPPKGKKVETLQARKCRNKRNKRNEAKRSLTGGKQNGEREKSTELNQ